jgi:WD40 repeat protein
MTFAVGQKSDAFIWDLSSESRPTPLEIALPWRQVSDFAFVDDTAGGKDEKDRGLVAVAGDKFVQLFDARGSGRGDVVGKTADWDDWITHVETNPEDRTEFAVAGRQGDVELYRQLDLKPPKPIWTYRGHTGEISDVAYSADGEHLVTASRDGSVRIWRLPSQSTAWQRDDWIVGAKYTADGDHLIGFTLGGEVTSYDGKSKSKGSGFIFGQAQSMDPSPDGQRAVVSETYCLNPVVAFLAEKDNAFELRRPRGEIACPTGVVWNPDPAASQIVAGTDDGRLVAWDADRGRVTGPPVDLGEGSREVQDLAFAGDGETIVAATGTSATGQIHVLRSSDLSVVDEWPASAVSTLAVSHDGSIVATASNDSRQVQVWDVTDVDAPVQTFDQVTGTLSAVTLSPDADASRVAVTTSEGLVYVWDRESGRLLSSMRMHADAANEAAFDPRDIDRMASAGDDGVMVTFVCDLCSMGPEDTEALEAAAQDRLVQVVAVAD